MTETAFKKGQMSLIIVDVKLKLGDRLYVPASVHPFTCLYDDFCHNY